MKRILLIVICLVCASQTFAQFFGRRPPSGQLLEQYRSNPEAYHEMKLARNTYRASRVLRFAGAICVASSIAAQIGNGKAGWGLAAAGMGLSVVSIPLRVAAMNHANTAQIIFESGKRRTSTALVDIKIGFAGTGLRMRIAF